MERFTEKDELGGNKLILRPMAQPGEHTEPWCVSASEDGTVTIRGAAVDRLVEYEDLQEQKRRTVMYTKKEVARIFDSAARLLKLKKEPEEVAVDESRPIETNPILKSFSTYQLKAELRRRRKEGGWFRYILWRMRL